MTCPPAPVFAALPDLALCWPAATTDTVWLDPRLYHLGHGGPAPECADLVMFHAPRVSVGWVLAVPAHLTEAFWNRMGRDDGSGPVRCAGLPHGFCEDNTADPFGGETECRKEPLADTIGSISEDTDCDCDSCRYPYDADDL